MEVEGQVTKKSPPRYDEVFPALPAVPQPTLKKSTPILPRFTPSTDTEIIEIPFEEGVSKSDDISSSDPSKTCAVIGRICGVSIELSYSRNKSLTVIVRGPPSQVSKAKVMIIQDLQQQAQRVIQIPHEYHGFLVGHQGQRRREIETATLTRIYVPPMGRNSCDVTITGSPSRLDAAEKEIRRVIEYHVQQANERLHIPREFHAFICGPFNRTINELRERTNTKIVLPHTKSTNDDICVSGKKTDVAIAVEEINKIYETRSARCITIPVNIPRDKHRLVAGFRGNGFSEILEQTGVVVEPPIDDSEEFTLRGFAEDLGQATTMVFQKASSSTTEEVSAPQRLHKNLIGRKGAVLNSIREGYESVRVDFPKSGDKITIQGPSEEVAIIVERLNARISELNSSHHLEVISVDPKHFSKLFGNGPDSLPQFARSKYLKVHFPNAAECGRVANDNEICIEGEVRDCCMVVDEITRLTQKWDNEKVKDVIVDPRIQNLLRVGNPPPIRQIEDEFPEVQICWPGYQNGMGPRGGPALGSQNAPTTDYVIQVCGVRSQVDAAVEKLKKLIQVTILENHEQEIRIFKDCMQRILGSTIVNLIRETKTRIRYNAPSEDGSRLAFIIGRQEDVQNAIERLEKLQKSFSNLTEVTITLPSLMLFAKPSGDVSSHGARLRSIREQCEGVQITTVPAKPREVTISGPKEAVDKAKAIIDSICAKMLERCADSIVYTDPKFHGALIGRGGANLKRFREKHDVAVLFPDRLESDPARASEIHVVGEKEAVATAIADLELTIKALEDETEATVNVASSMVRDMSNYRSAFRYPEFERVKVFWPRSPNSPPTRRTLNAAEQPENGHETADDFPVRIVGPKGCVEAAEQCLRKMVEDIKAQQIVRQPITESTHCQALSRFRSSLVDIQRNHNVLIHLHLNRDGFQEDGSEETIYGHIVITGRQESIDEVLKNEITPLLPVSEKVDFPQDFHGKLFMVEQVGHAAHSPANQRGGAASGRRGGKQLQSQGQRFNRQAYQHHQPQQRRGNLAQEQDEEQDYDAPRTNKLNALQTKYNVSIQVPPRTQRGMNTITILGAPDAVESCKAELSSLLGQLQAEKADVEARNYEECFSVEERFVNRIITCERDRFLREHGVAIFTRGRAAATAATTAEEDVAADAASEEQHPLATNSEGSTAHLVGYKLLRTTPVALVMQGYKEKVVDARKELEEMLTRFQDFCCEELHIPAKTHSRLIGSGRNNIRTLEEKYNVEVEFPPRGASQEFASIVLVMGAPADVDVACDELINKANDLVDRFPELAEYHREDNKTAAAPMPQQPPTASDFAVIGAPWEHLQRPEQPTN